MRLFQRILIAAVAMMVVSAGAAVARGDDGAMTTVGPETHSYAGAWPVTVSRSQRSNGTYCLTLTGAGNSGTASLVAGTQKYNYGSFFVIDGIIMVTIQEPLYGQNGAIMFSAHAARGHLGHGVFENVEGGSDFDAGALAFGTKGDC
jgi:hypothetical protein